MFEGLTDRELLDFARELEGTICTVLTIKASPPEFEGKITDLESILMEAWVPQSSPLVGTAAHDLAAISSSSTNAAAKWSKGKAVVDKLQKDLEANGKHPLTPDQILQYGKALAGTYKLGLDEVATPLGFALDFGIADKDAINGLANSGLFWIGEHYGDALDNDAILQVVKTTMLQEGLGREEAGKRLAELLGGQIKRSDSYWTGFAATIATRARSFGALSAMASSGAYRYEYVNPMDERTSDVCRALNGKLFMVSGGIALRDQLLQADTPEDWKAISPWPKLTDLHTDGDLSAKMLSPGALQSAGIAWPPLHFHCRSTIEVRVWQPLDADGVNPLANVEPENLKPPVKKPKPIPVVDAVPPPLALPPWTPDFPWALVPKVGPGTPWFDDQATDAWIALLKLQGYEPPEVAGLLQAGGKALQTAIEDSDATAISTFCSQHPPAAPKLLNPELFPPTFSWKTVAANVPNQDLLDAADEVNVGWLKGLGYKGGEVDELLGAAIEPIATTPSEAAWYLTEHPPGKVLGSQYAAPKHEPIVVGKQPAAVPPVHVAELKAPPVTEIPPIVAAPEQLKVPATEAAQITPGPIDVHGGYAWKPPTLPLETLKEFAPSDAAKYAKACGYGNTPAEWGPIQKLLLQTAAQVEKKGGTPEELGEALTAVLQQHPPAGVVGMATPPPAFLSPDDLGLRLVATGMKGADPELGEVFTDALTSERWLVRYHTDERQARGEAVANALYRRLGLEAPHSRVVSIGGRVGVATREPVGWSTTTLAELTEAHKREIADGMPVDAWLANWNVTGIDGTKIKTRPVNLGVGGNVLRSDNAGVFAFRTTGAAKPFNAGEVPELETLLDPVKASNAAKAFGAAIDDPSLLLPKMDAIAKLTDDEIRQIVKLGGFAHGDEQQLATTLIGRRDVIGKRAASLRKTIADTAKAQAEADRLAEIDRLAAQERYKARAAELAKMVSQGKIPPGMVLPGVRIPEVAAHLDTVGPVAVTGDHGSVRDHMIRINRYQLIGKRNAITHEGYEVNLVVDQSKWAEVEKGIKAGKGKLGSFLSWPRKGMFEVGKDSAGSAIAMLDGEASGAGSTFLGAAWQETGADVDAAFGSSSANSSRTMHGHLRLQIKTADPVKAQAILEDTLRRYGIDSALQAPSEESGAAMRLNKALWNVQGGSHGGRVTAAQAAAKLKAAGVAPESVQTVAIGDRGYSTVVVKDRHKAYMRKNKVRFLYHETSENQDAVRGIAGADGGRGGLIATSERNKLGTVIGGMSSSTDMEGPGGSSNFLRLVSDTNRAPGMGQSSWYGSNHRYKFLIHPRVLDRVDWYANDGDAFGALSASRPGADAHIARLASQGSNGHELMMRYEVPADDLLIIATGTQAQRAEILATLKASGVKTIHGYPLDDMVVVMKTPADLSNLKKTNPYHAVIMGLAEDVPDTPFKE